MIIKISDHDKGPYPNMGDRWAAAKRKHNQEWYYWQTALILIQAYGRSKL